MNIQTQLKIGAAILGGLVGSALGGVDSLLVTLLGLMAIDLVTGMICAFSQQQITSQKFFKGGLKKFVMLLAVAAGVLLDSIVLGDNTVIRPIILSFFIANEGISITENLALLGVPMPLAWKHALAKIKDDIGEDEGAQTKQEG